jgi:hypothetical protein
MTPKIRTEFEEIIQQEYTHTHKYSVIILNHKKTSRGETGPFQPHNPAPQICKRNMKRKFNIVNVIVVETKINK